MLNNRRQRLFLIIFACIVVVVVIISIVLRRPSSPPQMVLTAPTSGAESVPLDQTIELTFDKYVDPKAVSILSTPEENWEFSFAGNNKVLAKHALAFYPSTNYSLNISVGGEQVATINFKTQKSQGDVRLIQTIEQKMRTDYPLSKQTPYETNLLRVVYSAPLTLEITLKSPILSSAQAISQVKAWVNSKGGDASAHKYVVIPAPPLPSPSTTSLTTQPDL